MSQWIKAVVIAVTFAFSAPTVSRANDAEANALFVGAIQTLNSGPRQGALTQDRLDVLNEVLTTFGQIVTEYPTSPLAVSIITGQQLGQINVQRLIAERDYLQQELTRVAAARAAQAAAEQAEREKVACVFDHTCLGARYVELIASRDGAEAATGAQVWFDTITEIMAGNAETTLAQFETLFDASGGEAYSGWNQVAWEHALRWAIITDNEAAVRAQIEKMSSGQWQNVSEDRMRRILRRSLETFVYRVMEAEGVDAARAWAELSKIERFAGDGLLAAYVDNQYSQTLERLEEWYSEGPERMRTYRPDILAFMGRVFLLQGDRARAEEMYGYISTEDADAALARFELAYALGNRDAWLEAYDQMFTGQDTTFALVRVAGTALTWGDSDLANRVMQTASDLGFADTTEKWIMRSLVQTAALASLQ